MSPRIKSPHSDLERLNLIDEYLEDFIEKPQRYYLVDGLNEHFINLQKILDWANNPRGRVRLEKYQVQFFRTMNKEASSSPPSPHPSCGCYRLVRQQKKTHPFASPAAYTQLHEVASGPPLEDHRSPEQAHDGKEPGQFPGYENSGQCPRHVGSNGRFSLAFR